MSDPALLALSDTVAHLTRDVARLEREVHGFESKKAQLRARLKEVEAQAETEFRLRVQMQDCIKAVAQRQDGEIARQRQRIAALETHTISLFTELHHLEDEWGPRRRVPGLARTYRYHDMRNAPVATIAAEAGEPQRVEPFYLVAED